MHNRGLLDAKGELFAYLEGNRLYSLEGELTGSLEGGYIVDTAGNRVWLVQKDGVYTLDGGRAIGFFSGLIADE
jgi:hypothetical protein